MLGHSDGIKDVATVVPVTVWIVPDFPYVRELHTFPMPAPSRLEYVMSVRSLDAIGWFVVELAMDACMGCL